MTKRCGRCQHEKPLSDFNRLARSKDGRQAQCRACFHERHLVRAKAGPPQEGRVCGRCEQYLPASAFNRSTTDRTGLQSYCRKCANLYQRSLGHAYHGPRHKKLRVRKLAHIHAHKLATGCVDCGEKHIACLDFHHLDASKKLENVSSMINKNRTIARIEAEMAKCVVLCSNCHKKRHWAEDEGRRYQKQGSTA